LFKSLLETKVSQIAILRAMVLLLIKSRKNTMLLKSTDKTKLMLKKMLMHGELEEPQVQAQLSIL